MHSLVIPAKMGNANTHPLSQVVVLRGVSEGVTVPDIVAQTHKNTSTLLFSMRQSDALFHKYSYQLCDCVTFDVEKTHIKPFIISL